MDQIRILMTAMPRLLHELLKSIVASQPDMTITGQVRQSESVAAAARRVHADIVILVESHDELGGAPWRALYDAPRLKLVVIAADGRRATSYVLRPHQVVNDDVSPAGLVDAIRAAVEGGALEPPPDRQLPMPSK